MVSLQCIAIPLKQILTKTKIFCSISDSDVKHLKPPAQDILKFKQVTWDQLPPTPPTWRGLNIDQFKFTLRLVGTIAWILDDNFESSLLPQ